MATILEFRRPSGQLGEAPQMQALEGERKLAEIIIFPGVRIERAPVSAVRPRPTVRGTSGGSARRD